ncbi:hypothetical protein RTP6_003711 [Batrachochytrium dendrobatidis]
MCLASIYMNLFFGLCSMLLAVMVAFNLHIVFLVRLQNTLWCEKWYYIVTTVIPLTIVSIKATQGQLRLKEYECIFEFPSDWSNFRQMLEMSWIWYGWVFITIMFSAITTTILWTKMSKQISQQHITSHQIVLYHQLKKTIKRLSWYALVPLISQSLSLVGFLLNDTGHLFYLGQVMVAGQGLLHTIVFFFDPTIGMIAENLRQYLIDKYVMDFEDQVLGECLQHKTLNLLSIQPKNQKLQKIDVPSCGNDQCLQENQSKNSFSKPHIMANDALSCGAQMSCILEHNTDQSKYSHTSKLDLSRPKIQSHMSSKDLFALQLQDTPSLAHSYISPAQISFDPTIVQTRYSTTHGLQQQLPNTETNASFSPHLNVPVLHLTSLHSLRNLNATESKHYVNPIISRWQWFMYDLVSWMFLTSSSKKTDALASQQNNLTPLNKNIQYPTEYTVSPSGVPYPYLTNMMASSVAASLDNVALAPSSIYRSESIARWNSLTSKDGRGFPEPRFSQNQLTHESGVIAKTNAKNRLDTSSCFDDTYGANLPNDLNGGVESGNDVCGRSKQASAIQKDNTKSQHDPRQQFDYPTSHSDTSMLNQQSSELLPNLAMANYREEMTALTEVGEEAEEDESNHGNSGHNVNGTTRNNPTQWRILSHRAMSRQTSAGVHVGHETNLIRQNKNSTPENEDSQQTCRLSRLKSIEESSFLDLNDFSDGFENNVIPPLAQPNELLSNSDAQISLVSLNESANQKKLSTASQPTHTNHLCHKKEDVNKVETTALDSSLNGKSFKTPQSTLYPTTEPESLPDSNLNQPTSNQSASHRGVNNFFHQHHQAYCASPSTRPRRQSEFVLTTITPIVHHPTQDYAPSDSVSFHALNICNSTPTMSADSISSHYTGQNMPIPLISSSTGPQYPYYNTQSSHGSQGFVSLAYPPRSRATSFAIPHQIRNGSIVSSIGSRMSRRMSGSSQHEGYGINQELHVYGDRTAIHGGVHRNSRVNLASSSYGGERLGNVGQQLSHVSDLRRQSASTISQYGAHNAHQCIGTGFASTTCGISEPGRSRVQQRGIPSTDGSIQQNQTHKTAQSPYKPLDQEELFSGSIRSQALPSDSGYPSYQSDPNRLRVSSGIATTINNESSSTLPQLQPSPEYVGFKRQSQAGSTALVTGMSLNQRDTPLQFDPTYDVSSNPIHNSLIQVSSIPMAYSMFGLPLESSSRFMQTDINQTTMQTHIRSRQSSNASEAKAYIYQIGLPDQYIHVNSKQPRVSVLLHEAW